MNERKVLIISVCNEKLHELEFVKPVVDIIDGLEVEYDCKYYKDVINFENYSHVIICGTSLQDDHFVDGIRYFEWLREYEGKVFGICAGMQIFGLLFGCGIVKKTEIGFFMENFRDSFLGVRGKQEVYHLHNNYIHNWEDTGFVVCCVGVDDIVQAVKHKNKEFYGVLFHPEVRNKVMIEKFVE